MLSHNAYPRCCLVQNPALLAHLRRDRAAVLCGHSHKHGPHSSPGSGHEVPVAQAAVSTRVVLPQVSVPHVHDVAGTLQWQSGGIVSRSGSTMKVRVSLLSAVPPQVSVPHVHNVARPLQWQYNQAVQWQYKVSACSQLYCHKSV
jgi:hypothetical protein